LDTFRAALGRDTDNVAAAHGIVRLAEKSEDPGLLAEAAEAAFRVLNEPSAGARLMVRSSAAKIRAGDMDGAITAVEDALEKYPESPEAAAELKRLLLARREVDRLFDDLCQAAQWAQD